MKDPKENMASSWTREHPVPPEQLPPDLYFFIFDGDKHEEVIEVHPDRKWWPPGWWGEKINRPETKPPGFNKEKNCAGKRRRKRGRPKKQR